MPPMTDHPSDNADFYPPLDPPFYREDGSIWTFAAVEERLVEAWDFLQRLPMGGGSSFAKDGPWSQIMRDPLVDYVDRDEIREREARGRGGLRSIEVDRMNEALGWIDLVPAKGTLRRIVGVVIEQLARGGSQVDWREVKRRAADKNSPDALRKSYARCIATIAAALNRKKR